MKKYPSKNQNERLQQEAIKRQEKEEAFKETGKSVLRGIFIVLPMVVGITICSIWVFLLISKMFGF
tara:strand:+ start:390 stop:587 length:198 start_codon:yes stop_codon:yes gene_type:complete